MRLVARELGVSPMALYRHVANKDDLLDALVERRAPSGGPRCDAQASTSDSRTSAA
jgi:AcrR family transcriptional regulator